MSITLGVLNGNSVSDDCFGKKSASFWFNFGYGFALWPTGYLILTLYYASAELLHH